MDKADLNIAFVHNAYIEYRTPFFEELSSHYRTTFFFEWFDSSYLEHESSFSFKLIRSINMAKYYSFSPLLFLSLIHGKYNLFVAGAIGQINTYVTYLVSRLLRKPFIFWDENWYWPNTGWRRIAWPIILHTIRKADAIVLPGSRSKDFYLSFDPSLRNKLFIAPNVSLLPQNDGVTIQAEMLRKSLKLEGKKVILYCGRLMKVKGCQYLLQAFTQLQRQNPDVILLVIGGIYGSGSKNSLLELRNICGDVGANKVHFTGTLRNPIKAAYFSLADVVVVPSIFLEEEYEVWGFAVNESMSIGKPVVATNAVGSAYDLIQNGINGYIVPCKDSEAIFKAVKWIIENPAEQERMGINGLRILKNGFTYKKMFLGFKEAIEFILSRLKR